MPGECALISTHCIPMWMPSHSQVLCPRRTCGRSSGSALMRAGCTTPSACALRATQCPMPSSPAPPHSESDSLAHTFCAIMPCSTHCGVACFLSLRCIPAALGTQPTLVVNFFSIHTSHTLQHVSLRSSCLVVTAAWNISSLGDWNLHLTVYNLHLTVYNLLLHSAGLGRSC